MENGISELEEKINRLSNIKAIGWTSLIIFGFLTLYVVFNISGMIIMNNVFEDMVGESTDKSMDDIGPVLDFLNFGLIIMGLIFLMTCIGSVGLLKFKGWGLIVYQSSTIVIIIMILAGLAYYILDVRKIPEQAYSDLPGAPYNYQFEMVRSYYTIGIGFFSLLTAWILTRTNILLSRNVYRREFS